jgi:predicted nicotinamide N-methyase
VTGPSAHDAAGRRSANRAPADAEAFIAANLPLAPVPALASIRIHAARPDSGLRRLAGAPGAGPPPYWAYAWAGGVALARHVLERPRTVAGRRVLDFGAGCGLVAIAAARAGAAQVLAAEIDPHGRAAISLNAAANGVDVSILAQDVADLPVPAADLVLAGDVFYDRRTARRSLRFLDRCLEAGLDVLVGDPGRPDLPLGRLSRIAGYADVAGFAAGAAPGGAAVFALVPAPGRGGAPHP